MTWNYRVLAPVNDADVYSVIEVYYDDAGEIIAWSDAHPPQADDLDDLIGTLRMMLDAGEQTKLTQERCRLLTHDDLPEEML